MTDLEYDPSIDLSEHVEGIRDALAAFVDAVRHAGLDAEVPTCPGWTVRQLVAHQGGIHRWAAQQVQGNREAPYPEDDQPLDVADPVGWLHDGGLEVVEAIEGVSDDVDAWVFLHDPPPTARQFWARRQCHETTIHAVDALAASLGRWPTAADTWITREIAADGIDELLRGFLTRSRGTLRSPEPVTYSVRPTDVDPTWLVRVSDEPVVTTRGGRGHDEADVVLEGTAVQLYLTLWNRTDEVDVEGLDLWRRTARVV